MKFSRSKCHKIKLLLDKELVEPIKGEFIDGSVRVSA